MTEVREALAAIRWTSNGGFVAKDSWEALCCSAAAVGSIAMMPGEGAYGIFAG